VKVALQKTRRRFTVWRGWFSPSGCTDMKETNLHLFYKFGQAVGTFYDRISVEKKIIELVSELIETQAALAGFLRDTEDYKLLLKDTRASAQAMLDQINKIIESAKFEQERLITQAEVGTVLSCKWDMEGNFEREERNLDVFTVTPKGIYNTHLLIENPELKFPEKIRATLPPQMLYDLKQAGRCLAFEIPTACAFHVCRGTEAVMLAYYELLAKHPWSFRKKDWKIYIEQLIKERAPKQITNRLEEIRGLDRNAYVHPDINVTIEESPLLFELCSGVVTSMGLEMGKLTP